MGSRTQPSLSHWVTQHPAVAAAVANAKRYRSDEAGAVRPWAKDWQDKARVAVDARRDGLAAAIEVLALDTARRRANNEMDPVMLIIS